jgi:KipI family sensor histidine kinase inhibitor
VNVVRPFGEAAFLIQVVDSSAAQALAEAVRREAPHGVIAVVPGRSSVLVELDVLAVDADAVADALVRLDAAPVDETHRRLRVIPAVYGGEHGPDLADLAAHAGLSPEAVIHLHSGTELSVLFGGFAPGFAYLGDVAPELRIGRLATPRARTPAGSVALADGMAGIYPAELPGGWRVIGRTPITLFDPRRSPPAYLGPGDRVRFIPIPAADWNDRAGVPPDW